MQVVIHVGLGKTASSSIQAALVAGRETLAGQGYFYPDMHHGHGAGHWALGAFWRHEMQPEPEARLMRRIDGLGPLPELRARLSATIAAEISRARDFGGGVVILSDEFLGNLNAAAGCAALCALVASLGAQPLALAYARPDHELFPSRLQQQLKIHGRPVVGRDLRHAPQIDRLRASFGPLLRLRIMTPALLEAGNSVADFCAWLGRVTGRPAPVLPATPRRNVAMPAAGCALLQEISAGRLPGSDETRFLAIRACILASQAELSAPALALAPGWKERILALGHRDWNRILAQSDHGPDDQARARYPILSPSEPIGDDECRAWIAAQRDPGYEAALADWIRRKAPPPAATALAFLAGL